MVKKINPITKQNKPDSKAGLLYLYPLESPGAINTTPNWNDSTGLLLSRTTGSKWYWWCSVAAKLWKQVQMDWQCKTLGGCSDPRLKCHILKCQQFHLQNKRKRKLHKKILLQISPMAFIVGIYWKRSHATVNCRNYLVFDWLQPVKKTF